MIRCDELLILIEAFLIALFHLRLSNLYTICGACNISPVIMIWDLCYRVVGYNAVCCQLQTAESSHVHFVLVKKFHSKNLTVPLGCPAYDQQKQLVGFYVGETEKTSGWHDQEQTNPKFCPVGDYPSRMLSIDELNKANAALRHCIENHDNSVFCRSDFESEGKMIEEALIRWYMGADNVYLWE